MDLYSLAPYYQDIYLYLVLLFTILYLTDITKSKYPLAIIRFNPNGALFLCFFLIIFLGFRPIHYAFGDTQGYYHNFNQLKRIETFEPEGVKDFGFSLFRFICSRYISAELFLFICIILYIYPLIPAFKNLSNKSYPIMIIAFMGGFYFFSGAVNIIRMGIASSFSILAFSLLLKNYHKHRLSAFFLFFLAIETQASIALPIASFLTTYYYLYKHPKLIFTIWLFSIPLSLFNHSYFENFFISIGFDNRLESSIEAQYDEYAYEGFSGSGFRWDFLLYSTVGVLWLWYLIIDKKIKDKNLIALAGTYILSNAFWILVIRAQFSDRFAGLSWYLYPIILVYPLIKYNIWKVNQKNLSITIIGLNFLFTFLMHFIYYNTF